MSDRVTLDLSDGVADVRLSRPDKLNALDDAMFTALIETGRQLQHERGLRAVVLSGEGRGFCAGLDFSSFQAMGRASASDADPAERPARGLLARGEDSPANRAQRAAWIWTEVPVPVIAALHGVAFGGGLQVALGADIRIVAPDARLSVLEIKWGLIPDMSGTQLLRHLVRIDVAKELTFTGREVSGREAVEIGLATRVAEDPRADALEMAHLIASKSPDAIRAGKRLLASAPLVSVDEGLHNEAREQAALIATPNQIEAVKSNLERRPPRFADPD